VGVAAGAIFAVGGTAAFGVPVIGGKGVRKHRCAVNFPAFVSLARQDWRAIQIREGQSRSTERKSREGGDKRRTGGAALAI
jgi:hypothetical protein